MTTTPKFEISRVSKGGKPAAKLVIKNASFDDAFKNIVLSLGFTDTTDIFNCMEIISSNIDEINAVRNALRPYFDDKGCWSKSN